MNSLSLKLVFFVRIWSHSNRKQNWAISRKLRERKEAMHNKYIQQSNPLGWICSYSIYYLVVLGSLISTLYLLKVTLISLYTGSTMTIHKPIRNEVLNNVSSVRSIKGTGLEVKTMYHLEIICLLINNTL